ncbi:hypothetical protein KY290_008824 [Solanum tuberosum]|uniref:RNase H type-1 domain-containing protein n=2 Tax=Solanum TaxID=4107 RepID=A0ABQ7W9K1_SOLTU|nr:hypothetical protein KY290_008824 [Solanum tuberosum]
MLQARDLIEHQILWRMKKGSVSVWHDNWTGLGDLYTITGEDFEWDDSYTKVEELTNQGKWNVEMLKDILPLELAEYIIQHIHPPTGKEEKDTPCWMLDSGGSFTVKTSWQYIRHKEEPNKIYKWIWTKGVPFKVAFMMWRLWKFKIPVDDRLRRWGLEGPSKCWCCERPDQETLTHVFLRSFTANRTWFYFCSFAGLSISGLQLREVIMVWWGANTKKALRPLYRALPSFVIWELWRRRNRMKHEGRKTSVSRIIYNVTRNMPRMKVTKVLWEYPPEGWLKYNTDGASRGNPGLSSYAFCLRNDRGDIKYAEGGSMENTTNTVAEAKAILEACKHCKQSQYNQIIIQTDSMLMCKVLKEQWLVPWIIADMVEEIKACMKDKQHIFQHTLREGNKLADYLANRAIDKGNCRFSDFNSMEVTGRKIINSDKLKCPYLRIVPVRR